MCDNEGSAYEYCDCEKSSGHCCSESRRALCATAHIENTEGVDIGKGRHLFNSTTEPSICMAHKSLQLFGVQQADREQHDRKPVETEKRPDRDEDEFDKKQECLITHDVPRLVPNDGELLIDCFKRIGTRRRNNGWHKEQTYAKNNRYQCYQHAEKKANRHEQRREHKKRFTDYRELAKPCDAKRYQREKY